VLCELTGDWPFNSGHGKPKMGLFTDDGKLRLALKHNTSFTVDVLDLLA